MADTPSIAAREFGRPLDSTERYLSANLALVERSADELVDRFRRGEDEEDYWWKHDRAEFEELVLGSRQRFRSDYPHGFPEEEESEETLAAIEFERLRFYSALGWDEKASLLTGEFLSRYPDSTHTEEARQRFLLRQAPNPAYAFLHTAGIEAGETPWAVATIGSALGALAYFLRSGKSLEKLRFRNPWSLVAVAAGGMAASLLYSLRPGRPASARILGWFGLSPGRAWRAGFNQKLYGEEGDFLYAAGKFFFRIAVITVGIGLLARPAMPAFSLAYRAFARIPRTDRFRILAFHRAALKDQGLQIARTSKDFSLSLFRSGDPWARMGGWFWADLTTPLAQYTARFVRVGGGIGALVNVADLAIDEKTKERIAGYQTIRLIGGALMTVALVEFTVATMGLYRVGAYLNAASEIGLDLYGQLRTTEPENLSFFRVSVSILRTGIYKKAVDVGFAVARSRARGLGRLTRSLTPAPIPQGRWFVGTVADDLSRRIKQETFLTRFLTSLESTPITTLMMVPIYTLEGVLARVNGWNYSIARTEQVLWPAPLMQFVTAWRGSNYTDWVSIVINKFLLFWVFGQASYNCHPRYAGEDLGLKSLVRELKAVSSASSEVQAGLRREIFRKHGVKKFGHSEGGFFSHDGFIGFDQLAGYGRACLYTLTDDDQPLGSVVNKILAGAGWAFHKVRSRFDPGAERVDLRIAPYFDTLFTPELKSYHNMFAALRDPQQHGLNAEEARLLAATIHDYLLAYPVTTRRPAVRDVRGWEDWTLARSLAILATVNGETGPISTLRENPTVAALRTEALRYLAGTGRYGDKKKIEIALKRLTREAVRNYEGRKTYPPITRHANAS